MATEAAENRILDVLVTALDTIGPVGGTWNTEPTIYREIPGDSLPDTPLEQVYIGHLDTSQGDGAIATGLKTHGYLARFQIAYVGISSTSRAVANRRALNLAKDGRQALYGVEASLAAVAEGIQVELQQLQRHADASVAGKFVYTQDVIVAFEETHS